MSKITSNDGSAGSTLAASLLGFFIITLDAVVVNVALPTVGKEFSATVSGLQWVVDSYTLVFAAFLLSAGVLTDRIGARRAFGLGLIVFIIASIACGLAPSLSMLVAARFCQGLGAAVMMPSSMALIRQAYPDPIPRGKAIAMWALGGSVAATSGPVIGGLLTLINWRWIFFINLPVGLVALAFLTRARPSIPRIAPFDIWGLVAAVLAMGALTFCAIEVGSEGLAAPSVLISLIITLLAICAFFVLQRLRAHPMIPPELMRSRNAKIATVIGFTFMVGYFGLPFVMSLYLQQHRGLSAMDTGVAFLPMMLIGLVFTPFSAHLVQRFTARTMIFTGLMLMTIGLAAVAMLPESAPVWLISVLMLLVGMGGPFDAPPVTSVLLNSVPALLTGTASGVFNTSRQMGGALAVAIFGALLAQSTNFMSGVHQSLFLAAGVALLTALASLFLQPSTSIS